MLIKLKDYERIYKMINGIIINEGADPKISCTFFAFYGATILSDHYKIDAKAVSGSCCYNLGKNNILTFGEIYENQLVSNKDAFHSWVLADGWLIDFMAPVFPDIMKNQNSNISIPSKMIQKPINTMSQSIDGLCSEGDFYFHISPEMIEDRKEYLKSSLAYSDLATICSRWFKKPPKKMIREIPISDGKGNQKMVGLSGRSVVGKW